MQIKKLILQLIASYTSEPVVRVAGAVSRDYYFWSTRDKPHRRTYEGDEDTEERRNRGVFPLAQARTDAADIFRGQEHKDRGVEMLFITVEEWDAELKRIEEGKEWAAQEEKDRRRIIEEADKARARHLLEIAAIEKGEIMPPEQALPENITDITPTPASPEGGSGEESTTKPTKRKLPTK